MRECKHKFQPRYSRRYPQWFNDFIKAGTGDMTGHPRMENVYECDVCVRCGKVVKPEDA